MVRWCAGCDLKSIKTSRHVVRLRIGPAFAMIGELRQTAVLIKENNRAYMTFVIHDFVPMEQLLAIRA